MPILHVPRVPGQPLDLGLPCPPTTPHWELPRALAFIREHQKWAMEQGYYLALAGGVLNAGVGKDLDLVAMPRWECRPSGTEFIQLLAERLRCDVPDPKVVDTGYHIKLPKLAVEISIVRAQLEF